MMNNRQLADTFTLIANLCEIKGEVIYVDPCLSQGFRKFNDPWPRGQ